MPKLNPKHNKKVTQTRPMGVKRASDSCIVKSCSVEATHHISFQNLEGYINTLKWDMDSDKKKIKRVALCKKHYKEYKKLKDKDEKYTQYRDFGPNKGPTKDKPHYMLE